MGQQNDAAVGNSHYHLEEHVKAVLQSAIPYQKPHIPSPEVLSGFEPRTEAQPPNKCWLIRAHILQLSVNYDSCNLSLDKSTRLSSVKKRLGSHCLDPNSNLTSACITTDNRAVEPIIS